jgi:hypothetical protein
MNIFFEMGICAFLFMIVFYIAGPALAFVSVTGTLVFGLVYWAAMKHLEKDE